MIDLSKYSTETIEVKQLKDSKIRLTGSTQRGLVTKINAMEETNEREQKKTFERFNKLGFFIYEMFALPEVKKLNKAGKQEFCKAHFSKSYSRLMNIRLFFIYSSLAKPTAIDVLLKEDITNIDTAKSFLQSIQEGKVKIKNVKRNDLNDLVSYDLVKVDANGNETEESKEESNEDTVNNTNTAGKNNISITAKKPVNLVKAYQKLTEQFILLVEAANDEKNEDINYDNVKEVIDAHNSHVAKFQDVMMQLPKPVLEAISK